MKRQRGRGRKPGGGGNQGNRPFESSGPDVKIRGTAAQIYEKYSQYARDAQSSGDRVKYESYLQHAEHYFRIMAATMPREQRLQQLAGEGGHLNGMDDRDEAPQESSAKSDDAGEGADDDAADATESGAAAAEEGDEREDDEAEASGQDERGEGQGRGRRRRGRRRNNDGDRQGGDRQGGDRQGGERAGGERAGNEQRAGGDTEARSALDSLARRQGAL